MPNYHYKRRDKNGGNWRFVSFTYVKGALDANYKNTADALKALHEGQQLSTPFSFFKAIPYQEQA